MICVQGRDLTIGQDTAESRPPPNSLVPESWTMKECDLILTVPTNLKMWCVVVPNPVLFQRVSSKQSCLNSNLGTTRNVNGKSMHAFEKGNTQIFPLSSSECLNWTFYSFAQVSVCIKVFKCPNNYCFLAIKVQNQTYVSRSIRVAISIDVSNR